MKVATKGDAFLIYDLPSPNDEPHPHEIPSQYQELKDVFEKRNYRNPNIWLATKARRLRGCGLRSRPKSHITCSRECKECKECEGVNPHTPK
jgi:hypothetical protein